MPTRDTAWPAGTPCWTDYAAAGLDAAQSFYAGVVGWTGFAAITSAGDTVIAGPHQVGDLGRMVVAVDPQGAMFGAWEAGERLGIEVYNEPGGGSVIVPAQDQTFGRYAVLDDPWGAQFSVLQEPNS